jgi:hypothetical protein
MQRFRIRILIAAIAAAVLLVALPGTSMAQPPTPTPQSSSRAMLYNYYTAINQANYQAAYNLWASPIQTYQQFASGFSPTTFIFPYFGPLVSPQPLNPTSGSIRGVLVAYEAGGNVQTYAGCFNVGLYNVNTWLITGANFSLVMNGNPLDITSINVLLAQGCGTFPTSPVLTTTIRGAQAEMVLAYIDYLNARQYSTAWNMWLHPAPGPQPNGSPATDYRTPFANFQAGYTDTNFIYPYFGNYAYMGAAAGKPYLDGLLPAVLVAQKTNGTYQTYAGCYVIGRLTNGHYGIVNGRFNLFSNEAPTGTDIVNNLNIDCTTFAIPN